MSDPTTADGPFRVCRRVTLAGLAARQGAALPQGAPLELYERYFDPVRDAMLTVLALGVARSVPLAVWRAYFAYATIVGADPDPACRRFAGASIRVETLAQDDAAALGRLAAELGGFDLVIDDASHLNVLTARAFAILWPLLRPGGQYVIAGPAGSYGPVRLQWPGSAYADGPGALLRNRREDFDDFLLRTLRSLDICDNRMEYLHYHPQAIVMRKAA